MEMRKYAKAGRISGIAWNIAGQQIRLTPEHTGDYSTVELLDHPLVHEAALSHGFRPWSDIQIDVVDKAAAEALRQNKIDADADKGKRK